MVYIFVRRVYTSVQIFVVKTICFFRDIFITSNKIPVSEARLSIVLYDCVPFTSLRKYEMLLLLQYTEPGIVSSCCCC